MGNFTKDITKSYEFDGDKINVTMQRLKRADAMSLAPYMKQTSDGVAMSFKDQVEFIDAAANVLPNCVTNITGLIIDGAEASFEEAKVIYTEMYFMPLISQIVRDLVAESFITSQQADEVKKPQENTLTGSPTTESL